MKAEAEAEHAARRLTVAQEQMAEYAQQRESEAGSLLGEVQAVQTALASALQPQNADSSAGLAAATAQVQALQQKLSEAVNEAKAFSAQQQADADRTKRSYSQVGSPCCLPVVSASNKPSLRSS